MTTLVIPVKPLILGKQRLSPVLGPQRRAELVLAMLEDVLARAAALTGIRRMVVASDRPVFDLALNYGAAFVEEKEASGYNCAVRRGFAAAGGGPVAIIPADVPLVRTAELAALCDPGPDGTPQVQIAPDRFGHGTNGICVSSPLLIPVAFGGESFHKHLEVTRQAGFEPEVLDSPGLAHDIDTPRDLADFACIAASGRTRELLRGWEDLELDLKQGMGAA